MSAVFVAAVPLARLHSTPAQTQASGAIAVAPFNSIDVRNSGHIALRWAATPSVRFLKGGPDYTRVYVDRGVLVIDRCNPDCPDAYRLDMEVLMPSITSLSLANGGWIQSVGSFPRQDALDVTVRQGGTIDVRPMVVGKVNATVEQGGRILTVPQGLLDAKVRHGGVVMYWGNPRVTRSIDQGGVVDKGPANELNVPLSEVGYAETAEHSRHR